MVVTVEPGIYFSVYALQHFYLPSPIHSKYIDFDMLQRYLPVGGVRIEDDILITSKGYENLTMAPKGDAMLDIIRHGKSGCRTVPNPRPALPSRRRSSEVELPLIHAPGISNKMPQPIQRPLARASTMPTEFKPQDNVDFEPFAGPSLFSNFTRSMTTEEKIQQWRRKRNAVPATRSSPLATSKQLQPVCGESVPNVQHLYLSNASSLASPFRSTPESESPVRCKNCVILVQTLDRLRQTLTKSALSSLDSDARPVPETRVRSEMPVEGRSEFANDQNLAKELQTGESARTMRLQRELPIRTNLPPRAGPSAAATHFATRYTPSQGPDPTSARNPINSVPPLREQSADHTENGSPRRLSCRATNRPSTIERRNPAGLPIPHPLIPASDTEATLQKYELLRLRLDALEEAARIRAQRQEEPAHSPMSRPSMPNLMSHNPWQQHNKK
jgi:Xaa-Pro dipeptidase